MKGGFILILTKKSIIENITHKASEITRKMAYCFPDLKDEVDVSSINLFTLLFYHELHHIAHDPRWEGRDRLIIHKGDFIANLFAVLAEIEYYGWNEARQVLSHLKQGHSLLMDIPGIQAITDDPSLAMTLTNGIALWGKTSQSDFKIYTVLEHVQEQQFLENIYSTSSFKLDNVIAILRTGRMQGTGDIVHAWFTLGWHIEEVDLNNMDSICAGFSSASRMRGKPTVLIG
jgi:transketolase